MNKYIVSIPVYAWAYYTVEAESKNEAIEIAYNLGPPTVCYSCHDDVDIGDFDENCNATAEIIK